MKFESYTPSILPAVVRYWNRSFAGKRNFFPVTETLFRERVTEKRTPMESFDPEGFIVVREGDEVVGLIHVGVRPEEICRATNPDWPGGTQGYVAFLHVEPAHRRKNLGRRLWDLGLERLRETKQVVVDGQCINPFYGNSEGPFTPFWGTPEGVSVEWGDAETRKFLARKGHAPRYKAVQLGIEVGKGESASLERIQQDAASRGFEFHFVSDYYPELGEPIETQARRVMKVLYECVTLTRDGRAIALLCYYMMKEVSLDLFGIYETRVLDEFQGKGLGKLLLAAAIGRMRAQGAEICEVLTLPEISEAAYKLYSSSGFVRLAEWAIY